MEKSYRAIDLNNKAIDEIMRGNIIQAFELLSFACRKTLTKHFHYETYHRTYKYAWVDCTKVLTQKLDRLCSFNEGSMSFLYLKFLKIEPPPWPPASSSSSSALLIEKVHSTVGDDKQRQQQQQQQHCTCGFSWVLWYNLGILSALLGSPTSRPGNLLLKQALFLFSKVQGIVDPEPLSKHWLMLQLSILNNEACVLSDLSLSYQSLERLVKMGLTLTQMSELLDPKDQELFLWTVRTLTEDKFAAAA